MSCSHFCVNCKKSFRRVTRLKNHLCKFKDEIIKNCKRNPSTFEETESFKNEVAATDLINKYRCSDCMWVFTSIYCLKRHQEIYHSPHFTYPCCDELCKNTDNILLHRCKIIEPVYQEPDDYERRDDQHEIKPSLNGNKIFRCENCPSKFYRLQSLANHIEKYPEKHNFKCEKCEKYFFTEILLEKHLCLFGNNKYFLCGCKQTFTKMIEFKEHVGKKRPFTCCVCEVKCQTVNNLVNHIRGHTKEKPFACDICGKCFSVKESLTMHKKIHLGVKPYKCTQCSYASTTKWNLTIHQKIHQPKVEFQRLFLCSKCGLSFYTKHHLKRHLNIHNGEKTNLCKVCGKLFSQNSYLIKHLQVHNGYKCPHCSLVIMKDELFKHHLDTGHFKFVCNECKKVFHSKFNFEKHLKFHSRQNNKNKNS